VAQVVVVARQAQAVWLVLLAQQIKVLLAQLVVVVVVQQEQETQTVRVVRAGHQALLEVP
jgi:hypothetical protein